MIDCKFQCRCWLASLIFAVISGCGGPTPVTDAVRVVGTVTFDGQPLATGRISFIDEEFSPPRDYQAEIVDGKFEAESSVGSRRVEIRSWRVPDPPNSEAVYPQIIPARYNDQSELAIDIQPGHSEPLTFELSSGEQEE